jgi:hypothetical protein
LNGYSGAAPGRLDIDAACRWGERASNGGEASAAVVAEKGA